MDAGMRHGSVARACGVGEARSPGLQSPRSCQTGKSSCGRCSRSGAASASPARCTTPPPSSGWWRSGCCCGAYRYVFAGRPPVVAGAVLAALLLWAAGLFLLVRSALAGRSTLGAAAAAADAGAGLKDELKTAYWFLEHPLPSPWICGADRAGGGISAASPTRSAGAGALRSESTSRRRRDGRFGPGSMACAAAGALDWRCAAGRCSVRCRRPASAARARADGAE